MSTFFQTKEDAESSRRWVIFDAKDQVPGRLASDIACVLMGKHKPTYTPHADGGDFVCVINAKQLKFTGGKDEKEVYYHHTGYVGGVKAEKAADMLDRKPEELLKRIVRGMLPKTAQGRRQLKKMRVYAADTHPHAAQTPLSGAEALGQA